MTQSNQGSSHSTAGGGWRDLRSDFTARVNEKHNDAKATGHLKEGDEAASKSVYDAVVADIEELLHLSPHDTLLDIGCGTGALLQRLAPRVAQARGIDISPAMAEAATAKGLAVDCYNGGKLPYDDASFSVVVMFFVLLNIPARELLLELLDEALRVLAPGGKLLAGANNHPYTSGFRPTPSGIAAKLTPLIRLLRRLRRVPLTGVYSTDYDVFAELMARHPGTEARFVWAHPTYPVGLSKYHVLLRKPMPGDGRTQRGT